MIEISKERIEKAIAEKKKRENINGYLYSINIGELLTNNEKIEIERKVKNYLKNLSQKEIEKMIKKTKGRQKKKFDVNIEGGIEFRFNPKDLKGNDEVIEILVCLENLPYDEFELDFYYFRFSIPKQLIN